MTKPVAVFLSVVIRDSGHTVRLDENSHLVLFPSFSRYITSWAISTTYMASGGIQKSMLPAGIGYMAGCWLVVMLVGSRGRVRLATPTPNGHLPALFGGPFHVQLGEWVFVRWIGLQERSRDFFFENRCAWWCLFHSTKRLCMKRAIKKVIGFHPQGT